MLQSNTTYALRGVLRTGSGMAPHKICKKKGFLNNSSSMAQIGYLISILFKSPGSNVTRPVLGSRDSLPAIKIDLGRLSEKNESIINHI